MTAALIGLLSGIAIIGLVKVLLSFRKSDNE